jgi:3-phenylpropionate/cinnamic acid dioxygenase small subunit
MSNDKVIDLIYDSCALLDQERFDEWLALCGPQFTYRITTYSDELSRMMTWMDQDKPGMAHIFANANKHERYTGRLRRHVSMLRVTAGRGDVAEVKSAVAVYHTELNGVSELYAIGAYHDQVQRSDGALLLARREVVLDTRRLAFGPHVPM